MKGGKTMESRSKKSLNLEERLHYERHGYCIRRDPILSKRKFSGLSDCFEQILDERDAGIRPEHLDVPHFRYPRLFEWLFDDDVLDLVESLIGRNIALFSSHFLCKPSGDGLQVPWHEDGFYWSKMIQPVEVCTVWLAIDPSCIANGCMYVVPGPDERSSEYGQAEGAGNVFNEEIRNREAMDAKAVPIELEPNQASFHNAAIVHGSPPNKSSMRRCGYTMRYMRASVKFNDEIPTHQVYLARGKDLAGNRYADPDRVAPEVMTQRLYSKKGH